MPKHCGWESIWPEKKTPTWSLRRIRTATGWAWPCHVTQTNEIFATFGYFEEKNGSLIFEGAEGADKIAQLVESYAASPPSEMLGLKVTAIRNFEKETIRDVEGDELPKEKLSIFELQDRTRIAVRASGTEPKIKYYLFAER